MLGKLRSTKGFTLIALLSVSSLSFSVCAYAETDITSAGSSIGGGSFKPSTSVTVKAVASTTAYAATSQHSSSTSSNGGKQFGAQNNNATIQSATAKDSNGPDAPTVETALPTGVTWQ